MDDPAAVDDGDLVVRMWSGDTTAFDALYRRYSQRLLGYIHRMTHEQTISQDLLQEVFLRLVEGEGRLDPQRPLPRWLFTVAHNLCCSELRRRQVRRQSEATATTEARHLAESLQPPPPGDGLDEQRFGQRLAEELLHLSAERRSAFLLRHGEGFSIAAISDVLGCPQGTVKSRIFHAARELAERLRPFDPATENDPARDGDPAP
jgi:RNA polymerase sigma-70 factor, ECF subfamily